MHLSSLHRPAALGESVQERSVSVEVNSASMVSVSGQGIFIVFVILSIGFSVFPYFDPYLPVGLSAWHHILSACLLQEYNNQGTLIVIIIKYRKKYNETAKWRYFFW